MGWSAANVSQYSAEKEIFMEVYAIGIDLGKTVFHLVALDREGKVVVRKKCSRNLTLPL
jgi:hypothetical protein